jgi:predicted DNA-binding transcriptional regulator AlpA
MATDTIKYLNARQAAERTGFGESTYRYWRSLNVGPPWYRIRRKIVYREDELLAWIEQHRVQPNRPRQNKPGPRPKDYGQGAA